MYDLRKANYINCGSWKHAWHLAEDPTKVALVSKYDEYADGDIGGLKREVKDLTTLRNLGFRVPIIYGIEDVINAGTGRPRPAIIEEYIEPAPNKSYARISDLEAIMANIREKKIWIRDLQFLVRKDGEVVINDPLDLVLNDLYGGAENDNIPNLKYYIQDCKNRLAKFDLKVTP